MPYIGQDWFVYPIVIAGTAGLAAAASASINTQVQADSDFEWVMSTCTGNIDGVTEPALEDIILPINVQIQDSGVGRTLFLVPTVLTSIAGSGKQPFILSPTHIFKAKANINITAQNFGGDKYDNITWNLIGRKLYLPNG